MNRDSVIHLVSLASNQQQPNERPDYRLQSRNFVDCDLSAEGLTGIRTKLAAEKWRHKTDSLDYGFEANGRIVVRTTGHIKASITGAQDRCVCGGECCRMDEGR